MVIDFMVDELQWPSRPRAAIPTVGLFSCPLPLFALGDSNLQASTIKELLTPLERVNHLVTGKRCYNKPLDFIVLTMPVAILHDLVYARFLECVFSLLSRSHSVHLKKISLPDYGIPQAREVIVVLASIVCEEPPWANREYNPTTVRDLIRDLDFDNSRAESSKGSVGFACASPSKKRSSNGTRTRSHCIYNHETGKSWDPLHSVGLDGMTELFAGLILIRSIIQVSYLYSWPWIFQRITD